MNRQPLQVLTDFRTKNGMNHAELARFLNVGAPLAYRWETGARKIGSTKLDQVSRRTGIPKRELRPDLAELLIEVGQ